MLSSLQALVYLVSSSFYLRLCGLLPYLSVVPTKSIRSSALWFHTFIKFSLHKCLCDLGARCDSCPWYSNNRSDYFSFLTSELSLLSWVSLQLRVVKRPFLPVQHTCPSSCCFLAVWLSCILDSLLLIHLLGHHHCVNILCAYSLFQSHYTYLEKYGYEKCY